MESFKDLALEQAIGLRAESLAKPAWLSAAKLAFEQFQAGEASEPRAQALAEALAVIPDWPKTSAELEAILAQMADPIQAMLTKAFCSIGKDDQGRDVARLWGGGAAATVDGGELILSSEGPRRLFETRAPESLFHDSAWDGAAPSAGLRSASRVAGPSFIGLRAAIGGGVFATANVLEDERIQRALSRAQVNLAEAPTSSEIRKGFGEHLRGTADRAAARKPDLTKELGQTLLGVKRSLEHEEALRLAQRPKGWADELLSDWINPMRSAALRAPSALETEALHGAGAPRAPRRGPFIMFTEDASGSMSPFLTGGSELAAKKPRGEGARRAQELQRALSGLGSQILARARAGAGQALVSFLEEKAPKTRAASALANSIWGCPLSLEASNSATGWASVAERLMKEDPRRALLTLAVAPALGLRPSPNLLAESKAALKKLGLSEGVWKELSALPQQDFDSIFAAFKKAAEGSSGGGSSFEESFEFKFGGIPGQPARSMPRDPFDPMAGLDAYALRDREAGLARVAERVGMMSQAARMAGMPLTRAVGFCATGGAASSPAWAKPIEPRETNAHGGTSFDIAALVEEFGVGLGGARSAGASFLSLCEAKLTGPLPSGPEGEMEAAERDALRSRAPRILALAMGEAMRRPLREVMAELADLSDWFKRSEPGLWQQLPEKMSWASLRRREQAWHMELKAAKDAEFRKPWETLLKEPIQGEGRVARELASGAELFEEGQAMRHCVSSYAQDCREGSCRIYSITDGDGNRLATLEASLKDGAEGGAGAEVAQLRGVANQFIKDPAILLLCEDVVKGLNARLQELAKEELQEDKAGVSSEGEPPSVLAALAARRQAEPRAAAPARHRAQ